MIVTIEKSRAVGEISAPPSKSAAHRALISSALSEKSEVTNIEYSNDIEATLDCLEALGAKVEREKNSIVLGGLNPFLANECILDCRESGSTLRFMLPLCMLSGSKITLKGTKRLFSRNLEIYEEIAAKNSITFVKGEDYVTVCGKLSAGKFKVAGNISSQFITGLLFVLPLLKGDSTLEITDNFESAPYVELTLKALCDAGIKISREGEKLFTVCGGQIYKGGRFTVEGDYSNAAFLDAFNLIGGDVEVLGLDQNSLQGDRVYKSMYEGLKTGKKEFDLTDCPDLAPVMFALASVFGGAHFTGTKRLKIKESDRAEAMALELGKFGIEVDVGDNEVTVNKGILTPPGEALCGHNDHRIVMALSLLCSITGGSITEAEAVAKSYPDFFEKIKTLGIVVKNEN